jgi:hypothetical protein
MGATEAIRQHPKADMVRKCRLCNDRPVCPSRLKHQDYRCSRCRNGSASHRAANLRWRRTADGRVHVATVNARRIFVGRTYHSTAVTAELAAVVNAHIKERVSAFQGQQNRKETEVTAAGRVPPEATL